MKRPVKRSNGDLVCFLRLYALSAAARRLELRSVELYHASIGALGHTC